MIGFQTPLELVADAPDEWVLLAPLIWQDSYFGLITVPKGFRTDLASIPRVFRNLPFLDPCGLSRRAAVGHDWLYAWRAKGKGFSDEFLRAALLWEGASARTAWTFYEAVHLFGGASWTGDRGPLGTADFDTVQNYLAWRDTPDGQS